MIKQRGGKEDKWTVFNLSLLKEGKYNFNSLDTLTINDKKRME